MQVFQGAKPTFGCEPVFANMEFSLFPTPHSSPPPPPPSGSHPYFFGKKGKYGKKQYNSTPLLVKIYKR